MPIVVTILEYPDGVDLAQSSMTFDEQGGTLGRSPDNSWVLSDPERFLSGCHSQILAEGNDFYLVDRSTNGTYVNSSGEPLGKGERVRLSNGDIFEISDYKFQVSIASGGDVSQGFEQNLSSANADLDIDDPFASPLSASHEPAYSTPSMPQPNSGNDLLNSGNASFGNDLGLQNLATDPLSEETDPLAALDNLSDPFSVESEKPLVAPAPIPSSTYSDNAGAAEQAVDWPGGHSGDELIPQDWDNDFLDSPKSSQSITPVGSFEAEKTSDPKKSQAIPEDLPLEAQTVSLSESEARRRALEKAYQKLKSENKSLTKQLEVVKSRTNLNVDRALVDSMGFHEHELSEAKIAELNEISGMFIRKVTEGMMQTLASRNNVKNTFRMNMTTIQPKENNPLKFSANIDDALENMFIKEGNSYKKPIETVEESFESIADHQVAILAGVRSAFNGIAERFNPKELQGVFQKQSKKSLIPKNEKALYWESFCQYYDELFSDLDTSFQTVFGDEFTLAYEAQLQKLALARRNKK